MQAPVIPGYRGAVLVKGDAEFGIFYARHDEKPVTLIVPAPRVDMELARQRLTEIARVHRLLDHPQIAKVYELAAEDQPPFLAIDFEVAGVGSDVLKAVADQGQRFAYNQADGFAAKARDVLRYAHSQTDPVHGDPICLGELGYDNFLFNIRGGFAMWGFGHNAVTRFLGGDMRVSLGIFRAPEMGQGASKHPSADFVALILWIRSMLSLVILPKNLADVMNGTGLVKNAEILQKLAEFELRMVSAPRPLRIPVDDAIAISNRIRELVGIKLDWEGFQDFISEFLAAHMPTPAAAGEGGTLLIDTQCRWIQTPQGTRHNIVTRGSIRRVLLALVQLHEADPNSRLTLDEIIQAGWPGERSRPDAAANRAYVCLSQLRKLGLRTIIQRFDKGYRLDPKAMFKVVEEA